MKNLTITCPNCKTEIPLDEGLEQKVKNQMKEEFEKDIKKREHALDEKEKNIENQIKSKIEEEKDNLLKKAKEDAKKEQEKEFSDLMAQKEENAKRLEEATKNELELRKSNRELEEKYRNSELEMQRKIDKERNKIAEKIREDMNEDNRKKLSERDQQIEQMKKTIDELKRKSEQGSMQVQGDSQEESLKSLLQLNFPIDDIKDVPTGVRGADLIQIVKSDYGEESGVIIWESKITKTWSDDWIQKLKDDQVAAKADIAILVTTTMPKGVTNSKRIKGVWVVSFNHILSIISAIRFHLIELRKAEKSLEGQDEKMQFLYQYLSGAQFKNRIENIVSAFDGMKRTLEQEKRAMNKHWSAREKQIDRVVLNTTGMYGDLEGLMGASLPKIQSLELPGPEDLNDTVDTELDEDESIKPEDYNNLLD